MLLGFGVEEWQLGTLHTFAALLGVALSLYVMQLWSRGEITVEHPVIMQLRRAALMVLAMALLWSVSYALDKAWDPWPAQVLVVLAVDMGLAVTIAAAWVRQRGAKAAH